MLSKNKSIIKLLFLNFVTFFLIILTLLLIDFFYSNFVYKKTYTDLIRVSHPIYHHGLKENFSTNNAKWNERTFNICTDAFGSKRNCKDKGIEKDFDIAFLGDSFTEGVGQPVSYTHLTLPTKRIV